MIGDHEAANFALVPSGEPNVFHLTVEGRYIGTVASDGESLSRAKPWGWRLLIGDGTLGDAPLAGRSHNLDEALAEAKHAYERHRDELSHRM
ncbi:hypothetical protein [Rhizobium mesosinicum]|uniref:DUF1508 domain-containing protein n=1 Tax=Rhizobium mesosinicum TaxID=335017 RepID=A0ABS7GXU2_9HYPH|nr:hypothetical protein [Rhizobium mesosinicum]MBW9054800.1 hypothetical protein [Rhizobium mesosinicum]